MKRILITSMMCFGITLLSNAQNPNQHTPEEHAAKTVQHLSEQMTLLSQPKKDSLVIIYTSFYRDMKQYKGSGNEKMMTAIEQTRDGKVQALLSPVQYVEFQKIVAEQKAQH